MNYRKKPIVIEAVQWTGDNLSEIQRFYKVESILIGDEIKITTLEGVMTAEKGDWQKPLTAHGRQRKERSNDKIKYQQNRISRH